MERICTICNGLEQLEVLCPKCGEKMLDSGNTINYWGPYSPYEEQATLELNNGLNCIGPDPCIHILTCKNCKLEKKHLVNLKAF